MAKFTTVERSAFTVVGIHCRGTTGDGGMATLWEAVDDRDDELRDLARGEEWYGVAFDFDHEAGEFSYVAGVATDTDASAPEGMESVTVPAGTYAVVTTTLDALDETIAEIYEKRLPSADYRRADGPEFECYGADFDSDDPDAEFEVFVPVESCTNPTQI